MFLIIVMFVLFLTSMIAMAFVMPEFFTDLMIWPFTGPETVTLTIVVALLTAAFMFTKSNQFVEE